MANIFAGSEIVELGIEIEKNGRDFYSALAVKTKDKKVSELFKYLSGEEEKHIMVFSGVLKSVEKYEPQEVYAGEYSAYMKALADGYVFTKKGAGVKAAGRTKDAKEAVDMGIGFEKDSILFYEGMKKAVPPSDMGVIDSLITQEQLHLRQLTDIRNIL